MPCSIVSNGCRARDAHSFGRQFFRNCINNRLPAIECDITGIAQADEMDADLTTGSIVVSASGIARKAAPLPAEIRALLTAGGLIPFLQRHPDWQLQGASDEIRVKEIARRGAEEGPRMFRGCDRKAGVSER